MKKKRSEVSTQICFAQLEMFRVARTFCSILKSTFASLLPKLSELSTRSRTLS